MQGVSVEEVKDKNMKKELALGTVEKGALAARGNKNTIIGGKAANMIIGRAWRANTSSGNKSAVKYKTHGDQAGGRDH